MWMQRQSGEKFFPLEHARQTAQEVKIWCHNFQNVVQLNTLSHSEKFWDHWRRCCSLHRISNCWSTDSSSASWWDDNHLWLTIYKEFVLRSTILKALEQQRQWLEEGQQCQWLCAHHHSAGRLSPFLVMILKLSCFSVMICSSCNDLTVHWAVGVSHENHESFFSENVFCKQNYTKFIKIIWQGTLRSVLHSHSVKKRTHLPQILLEIYKVKFCMFLSEWINIKIKKLHWTQSG